MMRTSTRSSSLLSSGIIGLGDACGPLVRREQPGEVDDVEQRHVAGDRRQRDAAEVDLPGAQHAQELGPVEVALRPARQRHLDAPAAALRACPRAGVGMSTRIYCGMVGESCVTIWIATGGPGGTSCASAGPAARTAANPKSARFIVVPLCGPSGRITCSSLRVLDLAIGHQRTAVGQAAPVGAHIAAVRQLAG